jgi:hypothetical protein
VASAKERDPARRVGANHAEADRVAVEEYANRLKQQVEPAVRRELEGLVGELRRDFGVMEVSVRSKDGGGLLDKVDRMVQGREGAGGRPGYQVGDVIDAVGGRITVRGTDALGALYQRIRDYFGVGDEGKILEIENMYADPKSKAPEYRVIPMIIKADVKGMPYTFELQLTTQRSSIVADIEHNTVYKPYVRLSGNDKIAVMLAMAEAAAQDQAETRGKQ